MHAPDAAVLRLDAEMTIAAAAGLRDRLADAITAAPGTDLRLDLSAVHEFDSSAVQLLLSAQRSLAAQGRALRVVAAGATVRDALLLFGLGALLDDAPAGTA